MFRKTLENGIEYLIFASRWIQAPIYLGLVCGSAIYCAKFLGQLAEMVHNFRAQAKKN